MNVCCVCFFARTHNARKKSLQRYIFLFVFANFNQKNQIKAANINLNGK